MSSPETVASGPAARTPRIGSGLKQGAAVAGIGLAIGVLTSWPFIRFSQLDWSETVVLLTASWIPWLVVSTIVITLVRLVPMDPGKWTRAIPFHIAACLALSLGLDNASSWVAARYHTGPMFFGRGGSSFRIPNNFPPSGSRAFRTRSTYETESDQASPEFVSPEAANSNQEGGPGRSRFERFSFGPDRMALGGDNTQPEFVVLVFRSLRGPFVFGIYIVLATAIQALRNHRRAEAQEQQTALVNAQLTTARLQALQTQLQPHFLFNTLNAVTEFVHDRPDVAEEILCSLSTLLRRVLALSDRREMTLTEELELIDLYLAIQRHRFSDRLQIERRIESGLDTAAVPPLLLQPLLENAIVHGIGRRREPSIVELRIMHINGGLRFAITERPAKADSLPAATSSASPNNGIGLQNTRNRLHTLYGEHASLHAGPQPNGVFYTEVNIPLRHLSPAPCES